MPSPLAVNKVRAKATIRLPNQLGFPCDTELKLYSSCCQMLLSIYLSGAFGCSLVTQDSFSQTVRNIMSKAQDSKKETKKPAAKTAKEKQEAKKAKKAENARKEF